MSRATGKTYYTVEQEGRARPRYLVLRISPIGQGHGIAAYGDKVKADTVAEFLNAYAEAEA